MACLRVLVLMVSVGFCKSSHSWVKPTEGYSTSKNFLDAGACDEIVEISAASEDGITITTVPDPSDLFFIQLSLTKYVDYLHCDQDRIPDQSTTFTVTLSATKAGEEPVIRTITVNHVIPGAANSADPMFADNSSSAISINRNDAANTLVTTFVVTDDDGDTVTLSIPDGAPFQVTGMQISTSSSLENENSPYELEIVATDDGDPPRSSTWTLTITLLNAPVFTDPLDGGTITMCEMDFGGQELTALDASDADGDTLTYSLESAINNNNEDAMDLFEVIGDKLKVKLGVADVDEGAFDVDDPSTLEQFTLILKVTDGDLSSEITVYLLVEDYNDNEPTFTGDWPITQHLLDTISPGYEILQVMVTDNDRTEENRDFTFTLTGSPSTFDIDQTGMISLIRTLDYTDATSHSLDITVTDTNDPTTQLTNSKTLQVVVDTAPEFVDLESMYSVNENVDIGTVVFTFTLRDKDGEPSPSTLDVSISEDSEPSGVFEIVEEQLVTKTDIDAEDQSSYTLKFSCTDGNYSTESITVTINVNDENDYTPTVVPTYPDFGDDAVPGTVVVQVVVEDLDVTSPNNYVTWIIEGDNAYFEKTDDDITLSAMPSSMTSNVFELNIIATDGGNPPNSVTEAISITINEDAVEECQNQCQNGATCSSYVNAFNCACAPGWKGSFCDLECDGSTFGQDCLEICNCNISRVTDNVQHCDPITGDCKCNDFWEGAACETDVDECTVQPGICDAGEHRVCDNSVEEYACICEDGFREIEDTCQEDECLTDPCDNGGACTDTMDGFTCACTPGWIPNTSCTQACGSNTFGQDCGTNCNCNTSRVTDNVQSCDPISGNCKCNTFWEGADCETDVDECTVQPDICAAGEHRVCDNTVEGYACICEDGFREIVDTCQEDECLTDPCDNGGTCTDTMNGFTCACTPGWIPNTNCTQACGSNTFGQDCGTNCNCNSSRVTDNVQSCDPISGDCKCNEFWEGAACETDVDECTVADPCDELVTKRVCINLDGNYRCECQQFYDEFEGTCIRTNKEKESITPGLVSMETELNTECQPGLEVKSTYKKVKEDLERSIEARLNVNCTVYNIKCGSLVFDVAYHTGNRYEDKLTLISAIEELKANGSFLYNNQTVPISVTEIGFSREGNESTFLPSKKFCDGTVCYRCEAVNTIMTCRVIPEDNQELIWALGGFMLCLVVCGSIVCMIVVCYKIRKSNEKRYKRKYSYSNGHRSMTKKERVDSDRVFGATPWQDRYKSNDVPRLARGESHSVSPYSIYNGRDFNDKHSFGHPPIY